MDITQEDVVQTSSITLDEIGRRLDVLGQQTDWLCQNLQSLFGFVQAMSSNGGGLRGVMKALKQEAPELTDVKEGA